MAAVPESKPIRFKADASYLITGGLSGFGLAVAEWMLQNGARHLALVGRSGASSEAAQRAVARLQEMGGEITALAVDVASAPEVERLFATIAAELPPLRGIVHSAMVIEDSTLLQQSREKFHRVTAPKIAGAWNLHTFSADLELDHFVLFSSVSAVIGNPGQSSYAAANCFLDVLAHHRRERRLPALAINWGMLKDVGYVSRTAGLEASLQHHGFVGFTAAEATAILGRLLQTDAAHVGAFRFHGRRRAENLMGFAKSPRFAAVFAGGDSSASGENSSARASILALPPEEQLAACTARLAEEVAHVLRASVGQLDLHCPLNQLGFDSLMSVELANRLEGVFGISLPPGSIDGSVSKLTVKLLEILTGKPVVRAATIHPLLPAAAASEEPSKSVDTPPDPPATAITNPGVPDELEAVPPPNSTPSKALQFRFHLEALALRGLLACFRAGDFQQAKKRLRLLTPALTKVLRHDWRWAVQNLELTFGPNLTSEERHRLAMLAFEHHLSSYLEGLRYTDLEVEFRHVERILEVHAEGRGVILCGVHLGSWESALHYGASVRLPVVGVYRRAFNPHSDRIFQEIRSAYGIEWIVSKEVEAISAPCRRGRSSG